ncbi:MAG: hypothetical protein ABSH48_27675, partial [Verrucomicrobiota bacterium]
SEAGIANVLGETTLANPGLPNNYYVTSAALPGVSTTFPTTTGVTTGGFTGAADLTLADTGQAVSINAPPAAATLTDEGILGVVTFTWEKGANSTASATSTDAGDAAWYRLTNVSIPQMLVAMGSTVNANFITGNAADATIPIYMFGRNAGSGTRVNCLEDLYFGIGNEVSQAALNSTYPSSGVLTYNLSTVQATMFPTVAASLAAGDDSGTPGASPNIFGIANDGYDSGGSVSYCMSCDSTKSEVITLGYLGMSDALHAKNGQAATSTAAAQPGGAVLLSLDGVFENDATVVNGTYTFWGHEHLYAAHSASAHATAVAPAIKAGIAAKGNLGTGVATVQSAGILYTDMLADKANGGEVGYPSPL